MEYLLYLSGGDSGRAICLETRARHLIIRGGEDAEKSYYARECGPYEIQWSGVPKLNFGIDVPKSIETTSFPSSDGMKLPCAGGGGEGGKLGRGQMMDEA